MAMDINKFFKIVNLSASPEDGEALAAIRKAHAMLKANSTTWEMVILGRPRKAEFTEDKEQPEPKKEKPKASQSKTKGTEADLINHMFDLVRPHVKGRHTEDFIDSIYSQWKKYGSLTRKQRDALEKFYGYC